MKKLLFSLLLLMLASGLAMAGMMSGAPAEAAASSQEGGATITLNITKTSWAIIGSQNGESIGTAKLEGAEGFDHIEAEIRCAEDPDQYITFADVNTNGGALTCYAWEGGRYDLNKGYHYTLTVKAFDVPYYGVDPIATTTYEIVGTGKAAQAVVDIAASVSNAKLGVYGYIMPANGQVEVTFAAPVKNAKAWIAMGQDGSQNVTISQKDGEGKVWSVDLASFLGEEGSINLNVTAYDKETGNPIKGEFSDHSFAFNVSCNPEGGELDPIDEADGSSFEKAKTLVEGVNTATAVELDYNKGAYFKYTATEASVLSVTQVEGSGINFYNADQSSNYDFISSYDAGYVGTYSLKLSKGETIYVMANQGYGATGAEVSCKVAIATGVLEHGMSEDDAIALQMDKNYWFEGGNAYFTYTAAEDGVVVFTQESFSYGAKYTVDGNETDLIWTSATKEMNMPVKAGKTYAIWASASSYSIFSVSARFTQPKQGDTMEDPFTLDLGDNTLPKAAQKYYYSFINDDDPGYLIITAPEGVVMSARSAGYSFDNLVDHAEGTMRLAVDMDQEVIIIADRAEEAETDGVIAAEFKAPEAGDTPALAIAITSSETDKVSTAAGQEKYYVIKNTLEDVAQLNVEVLTEGISSYGSSNVTVMLKGNSYGSTIGTGDLYKQECEAGSEYIIKVKNATSEPIEFRAWVKALEAGDSYNLPIVAKLGENTVAAEGQKFYSYTPTKDCKLSIKVGNPGTTTLFFPTYAGDEYYGLDGVTSKDGEWTLAATAGKAYIFRMTYAAAGEKFVIAESSYGPGETRATAIEMASNEIELDDLAPYRTWYVYNVTEDGIAEVVPADFKTPTWNDNVYFAVNDGNEFSNNLRGYDASYNDAMLTKSTPVKAGDKIYIHLDVTQYNEGATITINVKAPEQGDLALTATDGEKFYATFSCDRDVLIAVEDAEVKTVSINEEGGISLDGFSSSWYKNTNGLQVEGAYFIPAGTGVVVVSESENIHYTYAAAPDNYASILYNTNLLKASSVAMEGDCKFYKLAYDNYAEKTGLGFYWGAADGAAFTAKQGGAYLAVPAAQAVKGYTLDGGMVDAIQMVEAEGQKAIYNLQGQRMQQAQKGINIVGGRKVLVK